MGQGVDHSLLYSSFESFRVDKFAQMVHSLWTRTLAQTTRKYPKRRIVHAYENPGLRNDMR